MKKQELKQSELTGSPMKEPLIKRSKNLKNLCENMGAEIKATVGVGTFNFGS